MVTLPLVGAAIHTVFGILMFLAALFLILLVLVQRGRGGGLSGALGGMGGQSAFGTRAGDTFTYVTIWTSAIWILLCIAALKFLGFQPGRLGAEPTAATSQVETATDDGSVLPGDGEAELPGNSETGVPSDPQTQPSGSDSGGTPDTGTDDGGTAGADGDATGPSP